MRITLNIHEIRTIDANIYTKEYIERDNNLPCDSLVQTSPNSKKKSDISEEEEEELSISPYSNIF